MRLILSLILIISTLHAETAQIDLSKVELPKRVVKAEADLAEALAEAEAEYLSAVASAKKNAMETLERERKRTRDGLQAMAIQVRIDQLKSDVPAVEEKTDLSKQLVGTQWKLLNVTVTFNEDGTLSGTWNHKSNWLVVDDQVHLLFHNKDKSIFVCSLEGNKMSGLKEGSGEKIVLAKIQ